MKNAHSPAPAFPHQMHMTLDTNVIYAAGELGGAEDEATAFATLISAHRAGKIFLRVPAIVASERARVPGHGGFERFAAALERCGLEGAEILKPIGVYDVTFWDHFTYATPEGVDLETAIWSVLFPDEPQPYSEFAARHNLSPEGVHPSWVNKLCDVKMIWSHITYGSHVFVSSDGNFHKATKKPRLIELGARRIETLEAAAALI